MTFAVTMTSLLTKGNNLSFAIIFNSYLVSYFLWEGEESPAVGNVSYEKEDCSFYSASSACGTRKTNTPPATRCEATHAPV